MMTPYTCFFVLIIITQSAKATREQSFIWLQKKWEVYIHRERERGKTNIMKMFCVRVGLPHIEVVWFKDVRV